MGDPRGVDFGGDGALTSIRGNLFGIRNIYRFDQLIEQPQEALADGLDHNVR